MYFFRVKRKNSQMNFSFSVKCVGALDKCFLDTFLLLYLIKLALLNCKEKNQCMVTSVSVLSDCCFNFSVLVCNLVEAPSFNTGTHHAHCKSTCCTTQFLEKRMLIKFYILESEIGTSNAVLTGLFSRVDWDTFCCLLSLFF